LFFEDDDWGFPKHGETIDQLDSTVKSLDWTPLKSFQTSEIEGVN
jgi:hypothetical protein